jgi:hypothetical protein
VLTSELSRRDTPPFKSHSDAGLPAVRVVTSPPLCLVKPSSAWAVRPRRLRGRSRSCARWLHFSMALVEGSPAGSPAREGWLWAHVRQGHLPEDEIVMQHSGSAYVVRRGGAQDALKRPALRPRPARWSRRGRVRCRHNGRTGFASGPIVTFLRRGIAHAVTRIRSVQPRWAAYVARANVAAVAVHGGASLAATDLPVELQATQ